MNILLGAPEITIISIASSIVFIVGVFLIFFFAIKNKIKSLNKKCDEAHYQIHRALLKRYELLKDLISRKDSLKKYEDKIKLLSAPVSVSSIEEKISFYNELMEFNDFSLLSSESQIEIHASDDLINETINKYNDLTDQFNEYISNWPNSAIAKTFGFAKKIKFIK